ncbi:DUF1236 domain-containing protein [Microvirga sp. M2]|uniref:DUF1236 domain-containing protein n=1 Tax=Microvirga sp. M2 TaxID=3073270 RepID=UPI0039C102DF
MRSTLLSTAAAVALVLGAAPVLAQAEAPGSSGTSRAQITPPASSTEASGTAEGASGRDHPRSVTTDPKRSQNSAPSGSSTGQVQSRQGSSSQDTSSTGSATSPERTQRPTVSGSSTQSSDHKQRPQQGYSQSTSSSQSATTGSSATSQAPRESQQRSTTGSSQQQSTQSGSNAAAQPSGSAARQSNPPSTSASSNTSTNAVASLNTEQRTEVTQAFSRTSVNTVSNVSFNVSVGTTITEEVRLSPLPPEVVRIVPQYRTYQYVVVRDEIVIVEPKTKKIVEVIHKSGSSRKSASVSLNSEQRKKFKSTVETTGSIRPSTSTRIEIREGATLPQDVEIMEVPEAVVSEMPELRTYRYVVIGDEVALVEPETRRVIEVIE